MTELLPYPLESVFNYPYLPLQDIDLTLKEEDAPKPKKRRVKEEDSSLYSICV